MRKTRFRVTIVADPVPPEWASRIGQWLATATPTDGFTGDEVLAGALDLSQPTPADKARCVTVMRDLGWREEEREQGGGVVVLFCRAMTTVMVEGSALQRPLTEPSPGTKPARDRVFFAYSDSAMEAELKVREEIRLGAEFVLHVEEAGYVEGGVVHFPPDEEAAIAASMQDGRKAPGA